MSAGAKAVSIEEQIECVRREVRMREQVYPRLIESGKMTESQASRELDAMRAALLTLRDRGRGLFGG